MPHLSEIPAGYDLDRLIAEEVMGWSEGNGFTIFCGMVDRAGPLDGSGDDTTFMPSTKVQHAWEVLAALPRDRNGFSRWYWTLTRRPSGYEAEIWRADGDNWRKTEGGPRVNGFADTMELAICRAALMAISAKRALP